MLAFTLAWVNFNLNTNCFRSRSLLANVSCFTAQGSTATINIVVKPRDSNDVYSNNDLSKSSWDYEKVFREENNDVYGVVKHIPDDDYYSTKSWRYGTFSCSLMLV